MERDLRAVAERRARDMSVDVSEDRQKVFEGDLRGYLAYAMQRSPELRQAYEQWRASVRRIDPERALPEPTLSYSYFIRSVETRVGPQRHKLGLRQMVPWPGRLAASAASQAHLARAVQRRFEAEALRIKEDVSQAYWRLWYLKRARAVLKEQLVLLSGLAQSVESRVETGTASLADLNQVNLKRSRLEDRIEALAEQVRAWRARLRSRLGAPVGAALPVESEPPSAALPEAEHERLRAEARSHPRVERFEALAASNEQAAERALADRYPDFGVGVDWIETGEARIDGVPESGKDAWMVGASVDLPLWWGSYADRAAASRAEASAQRAGKEAAVLRAEAELQAALSEVRDAVRRIRLYRTTLIPQAEAAYHSVLGAYQSDRSTIASALSSQRDLLELQLQLAEVRADYATAWARLEQVVGRELERKDVR